MDEFLRMMRVIGVFASNGNLPAILALTNAAAGLKRESDGIKSRAAEMTDQAEAFVAADDNPTQAAVDEWMADIKARSARIGAIDLSDGSG